MLFKNFYRILVKDGFIAFADLDKEDGSFHTEDTGVCHFGFDRDEIGQIARDAGFCKIKIQDASIAHKAHGAYPIFLLTAVKQV